MLEVEKHQFITKFDKIVQKSHQQQQIADAVTLSEGMIIATLTDSYLELAWSSVIEVDDVLESRRGIYQLKNLGATALSGPKLRVWSAILCTEVDGSSLLSRVTAELKPAGPREWIDEELVRLVEGREVETVLDDPDDYAAANTIFDEILNR